MKLYYSNTSPYSRKVRLAILEKGLQADIDMQLVNPFADPTSGENEALFAANPLGKIPTLLLDSGKVLFDSPVICHALDELGEQGCLLPEDFEPRQQVLCWEALADGLIDAAYNVVMERRRPAQQQSASAIAQWSAEIQRVLQHIEGRIHELERPAGEPPNLAQLALASAIGYLDFRLSELLYESACPNVLSWFEAFKTLASMQATRPFDAPAG